MFSKMEKRGRREKWKGIVEGLYSEDNKEWRGGGS
jgi:hypothetical protein